MERKKKYMVVLFEDDIEVLGQFVEDAARIPSLSHRLLPMFIRVRYALMNKYELKEKYRGWLSLLASQVLGGK